MPSLEERVNYNKQWRHKNRAKVNQYAALYRASRPIKTLLALAKNRASKKNMEFSITDRDVVIPDRCPVLGLPLTVNVGSDVGGKDNSISLDRIDNTKGYIPGNVQVISKKANMMKGSASISELLLFATWVQKEYAKPFSST